jgi:two-component system cell cycle sensor histidine kinase/response regulator CckA
MHPQDFCIVIAEDDELLRYCAVRLLKNHGYRVVEARDGQEALELVEKCDDEIHLLITNHDMPRLNGAELARRLQAKHQRLMVLMISGNDETLARATEFEVLPKPYNEAVLATKVRELLRRGGVQPNGPLGDPKAGCASSQ